MNFFAIVFLAIIVEGIITYTREIVVNKKLQWQVFVAICLGVLVSIAYNVDLLALAGLVSTIPFLGCVLTGILISRGSNYIFDLVKLIGELIAKVRT